MSILDTFYVLFKTNADEAADDIDDVDRASDKAGDSLHKMDGAAASVGASFVRMAAAIAAPILAMASFDAIANGVQARAQAILQLDQSASMLNSAVSDVDAFTRAIRAAGGETQAGIDSLRMFAERLNLAASDADSAERKTFQEWGLAFADVEGNALGAVDGIIALAESLEDVSRAEALARIKQLGIEDATTIDLLLRGKQAVQDRMRAEKEQGVVTENQVRLSRDYQRELGQTSNMLTSLGNRITEIVLPAITSMIGAFRRTVEWMTDNQPLVEGFFIGVAAVITTIYLPALIRAAAAMVVATWPFLLIVAAVAAVGAAFALAYEDLRAWVDGQPSLIGKLLGSWEDFYAKIKPILDQVRQYWENFVSVWTEKTEALSATIGTAIDIIKSILGGLKDYLEGMVNGDYTRAFDGLIAVIVGLKDAFQLNFEQIGIILSGIWEATIKPILDQLMALDAVKEAWVGLKEALASAMDSIAAAFQAAWKLISPVIDGLKWVMGVGTSARNAVHGMLPGGVAPPPEQAANAGATMGAMAAQANDNAPQSTAQAIIYGQRQISNASNFPASALNLERVTNKEYRTSVNVGNVTVNTQATDARAIAQSVQSELQSVLQDTSAQLDDGVDR